MPDSKDSGECINAGTSGQAGEQKSSRRMFLKHVATHTVVVSALTAGSFFIARGTHPQLTPILRPPGAVPEKEFLARCIRCGCCTDACPNRCITGFTRKTARDMQVSIGPGQLNTPVIFPRKQACILCNTASGNMLHCGDACPSGALKKISKTPEAIQANVAMGSAIIDKNICYSYNGASCGACVRACPFEGKALRAELWEKPVINTDYCIGCGLCERSCLRFPQAIMVKPRTI